MPSDSPSPGRRGGHLHRGGRRGHDRRGQDRRGPLAQPQSPQDQAPRGGGDQADVEQIMRDIRARIAQRHGIDLTEQQVQELAARRLESILDVRTLNPSLLEQLRKSAGAQPVPPIKTGPIEPPYTFDDTTLYESHNAFTRFMRKLLNPILKLFFNPAPVSQALAAQARLNAVAAQREAESEKRQAEWNALHYEILQRLVTEVARVSLEAQALGLRVESLAGKVDFNERRVRGIEGVTHASRPPARDGREPREPREQREPREPREPREVREPREQRERREPREPAAPPEAPAQREGATTEAPAAGEGQRRRRRRRRGRRGSGATDIAPEPVSQVVPPVDSDVARDAEEFEDTAETVTTEGEPIVVAEEPEAQPIALLPAAFPDGGEARGGAVSQPAPPSESAPQASEDNREEERPPGPGTPEQ
jgi:hypothetical protein